MALVIAFDHGLIHFYYYYFFFLKDLPVVEKEICHRTVSMNDAFRFSSGATRKHQPSQ